MGILRRNPSLEPRSIIGLICLAILAGCSPGPSRSQATVRTVEYGVEIISNPKDLDARRGTLFTLREELRIDLEDSPAVAAGLGEVFGLGVDSKGAVYLLAKRSDPWIYKFDAAGRFERAFGRRGQGPGETGVPRFFHIGQDDMVVVTGQSRKVIVFDSDGTLKGEHRLSTTTMAAALLADGAFVIAGLRRHPDWGLDPTISILDASGAEVRELDRDSSHDHLAVDGLTGKATRYDGAPWVFQWEVFGGSVYIGRARLGYEIRVFDSKGALRRSIRKDYDPVPVPQSCKDELLAPYPKDDPERRIFDFPPDMPAYSGFLIDDAGRLIISTFERDEARGTYRWDVFDQEGTLTGRIDAPFFVDGDQPDFASTTQARDGRVYRLARKPSGFQEIIVFRIEADR
jgi:hypothetical protein